MSTLRTIKVALRKNQKLFELLHPFHKAWRTALMRWAQAHYGINPKKVIFSSFEGRSYNDNPRYISERLHALCPEAEIVWLFQTKAIDRVQVPPYVKKQYRITRAGLIEQATARFWVDNFRHTESLYLAPGRQFYIQTWHGDRGFKRVGDDNEKLDHKVLRMENQCAMMIAGSEFGKGTYRTAFHFEGDEVFPPRTLCFEDRDGAEGLHRFYDRQLCEESLAGRVELTLHLAPHDYEALFAGEHGGAHLRSRFRLRTEEGELTATLARVGHYDPSTGRIACHFNRCDER